MQKPTRVDLVAGVVIISLLGVGLTLSLGIPAFYLLWSASRDDA